MAGISQMIALILLLFSNTFANSSTIKDETTDLEPAEANGKLEIIKQIKKVNDDGSYTIGYEADDGSFKIESRDVLGNIKGTYGYIDDSGQIKRVSYTSANSTEVISTHETPSVVQRIPSKVNKTSPTTRRPVYSTSTTVAPSTTTPTVIQAIPRRRIASTNAPSTTSVAYEQFIKEALVASKASTTVKPTTLIYETSTPARILAQSKPLVRATPAPQLPTAKSEGQLLRPEIILRPTAVPEYRRLPLKTTLLDDETKPVVEDVEIRGNLLRRQLPQDKGGFDARQHVLNIQQAAGEDSVDVYSASVTTGAPRPLFTTVRSRLGSTTAAPIIHRPSPPIRYHPVYQKPQPLVSSEYPQESSTEPSITPSPVPVVQIPANPEETQRQQYVELRHPFHRGAILVPVNSLQQQRNLPQNTNVQYQQLLLTDPRVQQEPQYYRRVPKFRPIPVQVDENGFIREFQQAPIQVQQQRPYLSQAEIINEVDMIKPPVSTKDFQKLLEQLIMRQSRLEKISALTRPASAYYNQRPQVYPQQPQQHQIQFIPRTQTAQPQHQHPVIVRPQHHHEQEPPQQYSQYAPVTFTPPPPYHPTKRMARLQQEDEEYLPAPVREMLLLRMLQLAINPALPLEMSDSVESATTSTSHPRKEAVRNVEILGEEQEEHKRPSRTKSHKLRPFLPNE